MAEPAVVQGAVSTIGPGASAGLVVRNAVGFEVRDVPVVDVEALGRAAVAACATDGRVVAQFALAPEGAPDGAPDGGGDGARGHEVFLVLAEDGEGKLRVLRARLDAGTALPSRARELPQVQAFERAIHERHGIPVSGHPWLEPLRAHPELETRAVDGAPARAPRRFVEVAGAGVHEVAVGPVHAGVIEPGHFRFQCHGERVFSLEIHLGYQHRGVEALMLRSTPARRLAVAESIAGDTAVGHALAHCMAMEGLAGTTVPLAAEVLRGLALELERLANHVGDLGALAGDVAYLPGAAYFGRLRGTFLNLLLELSGNRYGRGLLRPGGVRAGLDRTMRESFLARLAKDGADLRSIADLLFDTPSVLSRFERTGVVSEEAARALGLVGPVARASGLARDVRHDHPAGIFRFAHIPVTVARTGDVMARALVRRLEVQRSLAFALEQLGEPPRGGDGGPLAVEAAAPPAGRMVVALVEGWRGEIAHLAVSGTGGALRGYEIVDPSFHDWPGLEVALRDNQISDFPLCNKSFNLSYAGHDL